MMIAPTPFFADRGCHVRIYGEAHVLQNMGNRVTIYTYHNGRNISGLDIKRIINIPWYKKLEAGPSYHMFYLDTLLLFKILKDGIYEKPDIIHTHLHEGAFLGNIFTKFKDVPLIFDFQGSLTDELMAHSFLKEKSIFYNLFKRLEGFINNSVDLIIISSLDSASLLKNEFGISQDKLHIVEDGIDTKEFKPDRHKNLGLKQRLCIPNNRKIVMYQGLLNKYQGIDFFLEIIPLVVKKNKKVHFLIVGYPDVERYKNIARKKGIENFVTFTGRVKYEETVKYLSIADIAVSPKFSRTEWNGKLLYYMAMELPTVVFDTPINREILGDCGIYVKLNDFVSFAKEIENLLLQDDLRRGLGEKLRERVVNSYSWEKAGKRIMKVYGEVLKRKRN